MKERYIHAYISFFFILCCSICVINIKMKITDNEIGTEGAKIISELLLKVHSQLTYLYLGGF